MKYGRLAAVHPVGLRDLWDYLRDPLPAAPAGVTPPTVNDWGMLGNDRVGDCTIAGVCHLRIADAAANNEPLPAFTAEQATQTYFALSHGQDSGLVEANVLHTWHVAGLFGDRIDGYAPLDHRNPDELRSAVAAFKGVYLGVVVPAPMQQQFGREPFDLTGTAADRQIEGGHCVDAVGYDPEYLYLATWGAVWPATWRWVAAYLEEAWAVLTTEDARVDLAALQADLARLA